MYLNALITVHLHKTSEALRQKYECCRVIQSLVYNEAASAVAQFKDFLILDDVNEFLRREYSKSEAGARIPKLAKFYNQHGQVRPTYFAFAEKHQEILIRNMDRK